MPKRFPGVWSARLGSILMAAVLTGCGHRVSHFASRSYESKPDKATPRQASEQASWVTDESAWGDAQLYERIVAVVDKDVVTFGELVAEARMALVERHGDSFAQVMPEADFLETFIDFLIGQMLIAREARRMGSEEVTDDEVDARVSLFRDRFASGDAYGTFVASLEMSASFIRDVLGRNLRNERYTEQRLRTRLLGADMRAGQTALQQEPSRPASDEATRAAARQAKKAHLLATWLHDLRQSVDVQVIGQDGLLHGTLRR